MLIIKHDSPTNWKRIERLMDHKEDRMKDKESWVRSEFTVNFIQMYLGLENVFSEKVIQQCIGIVNVNGIKSKHDLMNDNSGVYGEENLNWSSDDIKGFIKINSNSSRIFKQINK